MQVYSKYKKELASPDTEEQKVWDKITREMRETYSYNCSESLCRFNLSQLKLEYENLAKDGVKSGNMAYLFDDAKEAFGTLENTGKPKMLFNLNPVSL